MRNLLVLNVLLATVPLGAFAQDPPATRATTRGPGETYKSLIAEFEQAAAAFRDRVQQAATPAVREDLLGREMPEDRFAPRFLALAEAEPGSETAADALEWIVRRADPLRSPTAGVYARAVAILLRDHIGRQDLAEVATLLGDRGGSGPAIAGSQEALLRGLMEKSTHREVRGRACLSLAEGRAALAGQIELIRRRPELRPAIVRLSSEEWVDDILRRDPDALRGEAVALLERVVREYGDVRGGNGRGQKVKPFADHAARALVELHHLTVGTEAPELKSTDLRGKPVRLSDYRGQIVVVDVWATWCVPCRALIPDLRRLAERFKGQPLTVVSISVDQERAAVETFTAKEPMPWELWYDGPEGGVLEAWNIHGLPSVFVIDARGVVRARNLSGAELDREVEKLVKEASQPGPSDSK